jgi:hypothetical protein
MASRRLPDNQEDREVYLRFAGEPEVLYVALDYAYHNDVTVTMAPATEHDSGPTFG